MVKGGKLMETSMKRVKILYVEPEMRGIVAAKARIILPN
jgi:hypothetical protein